ncbi:Rpn family recombination-promoting nuclease/putative transposase [Thiospirochaeta perfilievii]|uniref:Rpn family recombination-promoting nuclease/putative transposase n=1 Tax=Thiospirochaeta perfilievii TaxID=252967 RepID=A0A5C1QF34_9SPIO|nr:Rpn family recombination-promoting nuclease/putative transposase [Thiospirochaeta perfilievii]QEN05639.1 Rpn family recombination-promoting nuclease/putative transposase [Thiospirochaeta perfilievii]
MKFANPKNDVAFKKIFGDENKTEILISLLNSILDFKDGKEIVSVSLANPYQVPKIEELKQTILDVKAVNRDGEHFIVEMQNKDLGDFAKRSLYYTSKAYVSQINRGEDYINLQKVYFIGILNFNMFSGDNYTSRHLILNKETFVQEIADFEFAFIELTKFNKGLTECTSVLDKWIYFIKNAETLDIVPPEFKDSVILEAFEIAKQSAWDKKELEVYDYIALKEMDERNMITTAEKKGQLKERAKNIAEKYKMINNMKSKGLTVEEISDYTGMSIEDIETFGLDL